MPGGGKRNKGTGGGGATEAGGRGKRAGGGGAKLTTAPGALRKANREAAARKLTPLPNQYALAPGNTSAAVETPPHVGVKDYPPPLRLFQTGTSQRLSSDGASPEHSVPREEPSKRQPSTSQHRQAPSQTGPPPPQTEASPQQTGPPPPQTQASPTQPRLSSHSSQAQNDFEEDEETEEDEAEDNGGLIEPSLTEDVLEAVNALLVLPNRKTYCDVLSPHLEPDTTW